MGKIADKLLTIVTTAKSLRKGKRQKAAGFILCQKRYSETKGAHLKKVDSREGTAAEVSNLTAEMPVKPGTCGQHVSHKEKELKGKKSSRNKRRLKRTQRKERTKGASC